MVVIQPEKKIISKHSITVTHTSLRMACEKCVDLSFSITIWHLLTYLYSDTVNICSRKIASIMKKAIQIYMCNCERLKNGRVAYFKFK